MYMFIYIYIFNSHEEERKFTGAKKKGQGRRGLGGKRDVGLNLSCKCENNDSVDLVVFFRESLTSYPFTCQRYPWWMIFSIYFKVA